MVDRYLSTKFGVNLFDDFWENAFYGRTPNAGNCATALALLTMSSRAKKISKPIGDPVGGRDAPITITLNSSTCDYNFDYDYKGMIRIVIIITFMELALNT